MKRIFALLLLLALSVGVLAGCTGSVCYRDHLGDYVKELPYRDGFTILQLTDIHWSTGTEIGDEDYGSERYLTKVIREAEAHAGKIDLIEITGDTFMLSNKQTVKKFVKFMESFGIPYAITWGNHDREGQYNPAFLTRTFEKAEHSLYTEVDGDDVHERSNYVVLLTDGDGTAWQLFNLDSGASYREGAGNFFLTYDYLRDDQFEWLAAEHQANGADAPALCFYHIPQKDNDEAFDAAENGEDIHNEFYKLEGFAASDFAPSTKEVFAANNVKGAFMGHAHANDWTYTDKETGILYSLGVKSGTELYYFPATDETTGEEFDLVGGALITLNDKAGSFTLEHLYLNERENADDFVLWVTYGE